MKPGSILLLMLIAIDISGQSLLNVNRVGATKNAAPSKKLSALNTRLSKINSSIGDINSLLVEIDNSDKKVVDLEKRMEGDLKIVGAVQIESAETKKTRALINDTKIFNQQRKTLALQEKAKLESDKTKVQNEINQINNPQSNGNNETLLGFSGLINGAKSGSTSQAAPSASLNVGYANKKNFVAYAQLTALQENQDTSKRLNTVDLINKDNSPFSLKLRADYIFNYKHQSVFGAFFEYNYYSKKFHGKDTDTNLYPSEPFQFNSMYFSAGLSAKAWNWFACSAGASYTFVFENVDKFNSYFGKDAEKKYKPHSFLNAEVSLQIRFPLEDGKTEIFLPIVFVISGEKYKTLRSNLLDGGTTIIALGARKSFSLDN